MAFLKSSAGIFRARDVLSSYNGPHRTLHIGFVTTESPYGDRSACGVAAYLRAMIPALVDTGHRVSVFANSKENNNFYAEAGRVSVYHFQLPSAHWYAAKAPLVRR